MTIQLNTDKTISGNERQHKQYTAHVEEKLKRFEEYITRIEIHLSDENGQKVGPDDMRCLLEARVEGKQPIAVSCQADTMDHAIAGAIDKLKVSLDKVIDRRTHH